MKIVELVQIKKCYGVLRKLLKQKNVTVYDRSAKRFRAILVFDNGQIIEDGNHQDLMNLEGHYARMWQMQAGGFLPSEVN